MAGGREMEKELILNWRQSVYKTGKDLVILRVGYRMRKLTALQEKEHVMSEQKSDSTLLNKRVVKEGTYRVSDPELSKEGFLPKPITGSERAERRTEMVTPNLAMSKVVFMEHYRRMHQSIEKPISLWKEREGTTVVSSEKITDVPSAKEYKKVIKLSAGANGWQADTFSYKPLPHHDQGPFTEGNREPINDNPLIFANERARIAWEIGRAIERIAPTIGPEDVYLILKPISFDPEHATKGHYAILMAGTVVGTGRQGILAVPERTLSILKKLGIAYHLELDTK